MKIDITKTNNLAYLHGVGLLEIPDTIYAFKDGYIAKAISDVIIGYGIYKQHQQKGEISAVVINQLKSQIIYNVEESQEKVYIENFIEELQDNDVNEIIVTQI